MTEAAPARPKLAKLLLPPMILVCLLMTLLATMYLGSVLNPKTNLHDFPVAVVNSDDGDPVAGNLGQTIADNINAKIDHKQFKLEQIGKPELTQKMRVGDIYGAIEISSDFSKRMGILGQAAVVPAENLERPLVTVYTNPRLGAFAAGIVNKTADQIMAEVNKTAGSQLTAKVKSAAPDAQISGASWVALSEPVQVVRVEYDPLPNGTGNGLSAFYYSLLILLAGFTGSMIVHGLVDSRYGFTPTEFGPLFVHRGAYTITRFHTLLVKWGIIAVLAPIVSGIYLGLGHALGMPIDKPFALWLYGAFAIFATGVTSISILATIGTLGLLVNIAFFVILGVPSSGGTLPIEATPKFYEGLSRFEPLHQVYLGVRSILYFNARGDAGLGTSMWMTLFGLCVGLVLGTIATKFYDRKGLSREVGGIKLDDLKKSAEKHRHRA